MQTRRELDDYLAALPVEIRRSESILRAARLRTIYFGGGTPSLADPDKIGDLITRLRNTTDPTATDVEITLEANPETLTPERLDAYRHAGVNRLSLGAQSFDEKALAFLERRHRPAQVVAACRAAREAGIANLNLDLIVGLPAPHYQCLHDDLDQALALAPEHLSVYLLTAESPARLHAQVRQGRVTLPTEEEQADVFLTCHEKLTEADYEHYEVSNYARPGFRSRHNSDCWAGRPYLGLGAGAHSYVEQEGRWWRWGNVAEPEEYAERLRDGQPPIAFREEITPHVARRERLMLQLRTESGIAPADFGGHETALLKAMRSLARKGWYWWEDKRFRPTPTGMLVADAVTADLWDVLDGKAEKED